MLGEGRSARRSTRAGAHHAPVAQDHLEAQEPIGEEAASDPHGVLGDRPADRGVQAGERPAEDDRHARPLERADELRPGDAGLHDDVPVVGVDLHDPVHATEVEDDRLGPRRGVRQRVRHAAAASDDREAGAGGNPHGLDHLGRRRRAGDRDGHRHLGIREVDRVPTPLGLVREHVLVAEQGSELLERARDLSAIVRDGCGHRISPWSSQLIRPR